MQIKVPDIDAIEDSDKLERILINAKNKGLDDVVMKIKKRLFKLAGRDEIDAVEKLFAEFLASYELYLKEKNDGKNTRAQYVRRALKTKGAKKTFEDMASKKTLSEGFTGLVDNGLAEFTAEWIVANNPDLFDLEAVNKAQEKLSKLDC